VMSLVSDRSTSPSLASLFQPRSIAVLGASDKPFRIGYQVVKSLIDGDFSGPVYPVNPRLSGVLGQPAYPSVDAIPTDVDLGIIVLGKDHVLDAVKACGQKRMRAIIVMSSGFGELGNMKAERQLASEASQYGMRMLGPNCAGYAAIWEHVYASFENRVQQGHLAFLSQSGAMCAVILALARAEALGLSMFVSYGNAADVNPEEVLQYLSTHAPTQLIGCYIEGLRHARAFLSVARTVAPNKPVLVLKPGNTPAAARAIKSHTGALAGDQALYTGAFHQAGVLQARNLDEFIDAAKALTTQPLPRGNRVAIVTNAGGPSVLAVDDCSHAGLDVHPFPASLRKAFASFLPPVCPMANPVDVGPEAEPGMYQRVVELLLSSSSVDMVLVLCAPPVFADIRAISRAMVDAKKMRSRKPLVCCWLAGDMVTAGLPVLAEAGIPNFPTPHRAATALRFLVLRSQWLRHQRGRKAVGTVSPQD
jgi:acyl-CoA synthetase (NDP forming)